MTRAQIIYERVYRVTRHGLPATYGTADAHDFDTVDEAAAAIAERLRAQPTIPLLVEMVDLKPTAQ